VPTVEGWEPALPRPTRVFVAHGRADPIIEIDFARRAKQLLEQAGMDVEYHEGDYGHWVEPAALAAATRWLEAT
jgi:phospholipase/carboxylesterase